MTTVSITRQTVDAIWAAVAAQHLHDQDPDGLAQLSADHRDRDDLLLMLEDLDRGPTVYAQTCHARGHDPLKGRP
jgi:hypothetical protein